MWISNTIILLFFIAFFVFLKRRSNHFKNNGVKYMNLRKCLLGIFKCITGRMSIIDYFQSMVFPYTGERYTGTFELLSPVIILRHPMALKRVCMERADCFMNHRHVFDDPILSNMLFCVKDDKWKKLRSELSPAISGNKINIMFDLASFCSKHTIETIIEKTNKEHLANDAESAAKELNMKDVTTNYAIFMLSKLMFDDISEKGSKEILTTVLKCDPITGVNLFKLFLLFLLPKFLRFDFLMISPAKVVIYLCDVFKHAVKLRNKNNTYIPDFIQMLASKNDWTLIEKTAQMQTYSITFCNAVPVQITNTLYELSRNCEILNRLKAEVDKTDEEVDGEITYEALNNMEYMDMVVSEGLRKWPAVSITDRVCSKDCNLGPVRDNDDASYTVHKGQLIGIPIIAIHNDPEFWPNPKIFDPERFSKINKRKIAPFTYTPFGVGPRNCIASRQGLMFVKVFLYHIVLNFNIYPGQSMANEERYEKKTLLNTVMGGVWLQLEPRNY